MKTAKNETGINTQNTVLNQEPKPRETSTYSSGDDLAKNARPPEYLVDAVLPVGSNGILRGETMAFKTFTALNLAHSVSTGRPFFGHTVFKPGKVIYVCGDGMGGIPRRLKALEISEGKFNDDVYLYLDSRFRIDDPEIMAELRQSIEELQPVLIIFDALTSLAFTMDENSRLDVASTIQLIKDTCSFGDTSTLIVHHYDDYSGKGLGSTPLMSCVDFAWEMNRVPDSMSATLRCLKNNEGEAFTDIDLLAQIVDIPPIEDGESYTSLVINPKH